MRLWFPVTRTISRPGAAARHPERVAAPCTTSVGTSTASSSAWRLFSGTTRRVERKRQAQDGDRAGLGSGPAGDTRAQRPAAGHQRQVLQLLAEALDDRRPPLVEPGRWSRRAPTGHDVGLLDERDAESLLQRDVCRRDQVRGAHPPRPRARAPARPSARGRVTCASPDRAGLDLEFAAAPLAVTPPASPILVH